MQLAQQWLADYGYAGLFLAVALESFGIPLPGQSSLMASAVLARHGEMNIIWVMIVAWSAAFGGDTLGYWIGRRWGHKPLARLPVSEAALLHVEAAYLRYGGLIVIVARFIEGFRQLNGIVAGTMGMTWHTFLLFNAIGALLWCATWGLGLYYASGTIMHLWQTLEPLHIWGWAIIAVAVVLGGIYLLWRIRINRRK